jgi:copper homeostasis protein
MQTILLEIAAATVPAAIAAQEAGAGRIELCDNLGEGGTTPGYGMIALARELLHIPLYPIIRPRGGDFLYDAIEFEIMKRDIRVCKELGCDGIVTGILKADGTIDTARCAELVAIAHPMKVTFHRAFDRAIDPFNALEDIIGIGCERILSSGQQPGAPQGAVLLRQLIEQAGNRIIIMPGAGIRASNIAALVQTTGACEYHSSAKTMIESKMQFHHPSFSKGGEDFSIPFVDVEEIKNIISIAVLNLPS